MADRQNHVPPHACYPAELSYSRSNAVGIIRGHKKSGSARAPTFFGWGPLRNMGSGQLVTQSTRQSISVTSSLRQFCTL